MIVCDFEGTIYNEAKLRRDFRRVFGSFDLDFETIFRKTAKHGHFCLEALNRTSLKKSQKARIIQECKKLIGNGSVYVFADAKQFLQKNLGKVSILSYGSSEFQKEKIVGSGIAKFIKQVEITQLHKRESKDLFLKADIYIDNDPTVLQEISQSFNKIKLYLIDRDNKCDVIPDNIIKVKDLAEVKNVESRRIKTKKQKDRSKI